MSSDLMRKYLDVVNEWTGYLHVRNETEKIAAGIAYDLEKKLADPYGEVVHHQMNILMKIKKYKGGYWTFTPDEKFAEFRIPVWTPEMEKIVKDWYNTIVAPLKNKGYQVTQMVVNNSYQAPFGPNGEVQSLRTVTGRDKQGNAITTPIQIYEFSIGKPEDANSPAA